MDDLGASLLLARVFAGPLTAFAAALVLVLVLAPVVLYVIARWRAHRDATDDTHLGIKFALHYFAISAFQLALAGGAILLWTIISPGAADAKTTPYRMAFGLLVPAGIVLALHVLLLKRTNDDQLIGVRRLFAGYNLIVTGLVGFSALVVGFQALFAKGSTHGVGHAAGAMVLVYGTAWALVGWRFGQLVLGPTAGVAPGLASTSASAPPPPVAAAGAGGGALPSLGGGAYPPIDHPPRDR